MRSGQVERFNQTLLKMLGTLVESKKSGQKAHAPTLVNAYNASFHDSTGYLPYWILALLSNVWTSSPSSNQCIFRLESRYRTASTHTEYVNKLTSRTRRRAKSTRKVLYATNQSIWFESQKRSSRSSCACQKCWDMWKTQTSRQLGAQSLRCLGTSETWYPGVSCSFGRSKKPYFTFHGPTLFGSCSATHPVRNRRSRTTEFYRCWHRPKRSSSHRRILN